MLLALFVTARGEPPKVRFVDVTARTGISFVHSCGSREKDWIVEVNGSGVGLFDYDADGDLDVYLVNASIFKPKPTDQRPRNALYRNDGNWTFVDVTEEANVGDQGWGSGVSVADIDNDGFLDIYVTNWGPNVLYRNRGNGSFEHVKGSGAEDPRWSSSACLADFNGDGLVDIYVANYVKFEFNPKKKRGVPECLYKGVPIFCGPGGLTPAPDTLYLNAGGGRFRDATAEWGVRKPASGFGMGSLVVDVQPDGFPDVLVANDSNKNLCFVNMRGKRFAEAGVFLGLAYNDFGVEQAGMGVTSGDLRGRGRDDIFVTNYEDDTNTLYLAGVGGLYTEGTFPAKLGTDSYRNMSWGTFFFDADGDGDLDLFVATGHLAPQMANMRSSIGYRQENQLFINTGSQKFKICRSGLPDSSKTKRSSRGAAFGDLDGDGDPDLVISNIDDPPTVLENRTEARWINARLRGTRCNRAAIGARVTIHTGGRRQSRTIQSGMSYASQCELSARFGLGTAKRVDSLRVEWPGGSTETFPPPRPGQTVTLTEGEGKRIAR